MGIPIAKSYSAVATAQVVKRVRCEECEHVYYYLHEVTTTGESDAAFVLASSDSLNQQARERAAEALQRELDKPEPVPCPKCGRYQTDMVPIVRERHLRWMSQIGIALCALAALIGFVAIFNSYILFWSRWTGEKPAFAGLTLVGIWIATAAVGAVGYWLIVFRRRLGKQFDPNKGFPDNRCRIGRDLSLTHEQVADLRTG